MVGHDEAPESGHVGVGALPRDEEVVGVSAREGEAAHRRQRAQLRILEGENYDINEMSEACTRLRYVVFKRLQIR